MSDHSSDSDNDAPESISLSTTRKDARQQERKLNQALVESRQKKRAQNRARDERLKARAAEKKEKQVNAEIEGEHQEEETDDESMEIPKEGDLDEEEEGEGSSGEGDSESSEEEFQGIGHSSDEEGIMVDDNEDSEEDEEMAEPGPSSKHLPDHLFAAAFAAKPSTKLREPKTKQKSLQRRRKHKHTTKDLIVGSKIVRTLTRPKPAAAPVTKVRRFLNKRLALEEPKKRNKTWERRPANIGAMRTSIGGPPSNFRRSSELSTFSTCEISDALVKLGRIDGGLVPDLKSYSPAIPVRICGPAYTVQMVLATNSDAPKLSEHFVDTAPEGSVVFVDAPEEAKNAVWGGLMSAGAQARRALGVVISGRCRDIGEHRALGFPVFARGQSTVGASPHTRPCAVNVALVIKPHQPSTFPPIVINSGDFIIADEDGVVCIPRDMLHDVLEVAARGREVDELCMKDIKAGLGVQSSFKKHRGK